MRVHNITYLENRERLEAWKQHNIQNRRTVPQDTEPLFLAILGIIVVSSVALMVFYGWNGYLLVDSLIVVRK